MAIFTNCKPDELINVSQAAKLLGVSRPTIYDMIERGDLAVLLVAGRQLVAKGDVEDLKRRRSGGPK